MVKKYLVILNASWLILHCIFSFGCPSAWIGFVAISLPIIFSLIFTGDDNISCASFMPLALLAVVGLWGKDSLSIFFRCISSSDAYSLSSTVTIIYTLANAPAFRYGGELVNKFCCDPEYGVAAAISFVWVWIMFSCPFLVFEGLWVMLISACVKDARGAVSILIGGILILLAAELPSIGFSHYLVVKCLLPKSTHIIYVACVVVMTVWYLRIWNKRHGQQEGQR